MANWVNTRLLKSWLQVGWVDTGSGRLSISCYFLNFKLNSRPSEYQMRSSEGLRDQLVALIDIGPKNQWEKNKQLNSPKTSVWLEPFQALQTLDLEFHQMCVGGGGGPRASEQSQIYPPWSKSIISEQCNSTLITACHKISYSLTPAQAKSRIHTDAYAHILLLDFH